MRRQKRKMTEFLVLAVVLSLTACSGKTTEAETETQSESTTEAEFAGIIDVKTDWKATFEAVLMKERGVKPDHYEELGRNLSGLCGEGWKSHSLRHRRFHYRRVPRIKMRKFFNNPLPQAEDSCYNNSKPRLYAEKRKDEGSW